MVWSRLDCPEEEIFKLTLENYFFQVTDTQVKVV